MSMTTEQVGTIQMNGRRWSLEEFSEDLLLVVRQRREQWLTSMRLEGARYEAEIAAIDAELAKRDWVEGRREWEEA